MHTYPRGICQKVLCKKSFFTYFECLQPYQVEHTSFRMITEVKQLWAESRHQTFFSDYWLCKIPYKEISPLYLLCGSIETKFDVMMSEKLKKLVLRSVASHFILVVARKPGMKLMFYRWKVHNTWLFTQIFFRSQNCHISPSIRLRF